MSFAENVKKLRTEKGLTQAELANLIGIAQPTLAQYEKGLKLPTILTGVTLAQKLGTTCEMLVCDQKGA
ncbi:MAG: helix-turn-helix domain-containing protein [Alistipes sp.]|nr:helix-turn-helix domain-containing protein [Alistipes sp.]